MDEGVVFEVVPGELAGGGRLEVGFWGRGGCGCLGVGDGCVGEEEKEGKEDMEVCSQCALGVLYVFVHDRLGYSRVVERFYAYLPGKVSGERAGRETPYLIYLVGVPSLKWGIAGKG